MKIDNPSVTQYAGLKALWMTCFGDTDAFVDRFFAVAFSPERCLCVTRQEEILAAAYWLDVEFDNKKAAYIYAVATDPAHRGQGLCRQLMEAIHQILLSQGYAGAMLVPGEPGLREMYEKMGYADFGGIREFACLAASDVLPVRQITKAEYAALRRSYLPAGGVAQEGACLDFLSQFYRFYQTEDHIFAAASTGCELFAAELLGDSTAAPAILAAFGVRSGVFRVPGSDPFAMYHSLDGAEAPEYFAFAFD